MAIQPSIAVQNQQNLDALDAYISQLDEQLSKNSIKSSPSYGEIGGKVVHQDIHQENKVQAQELLANIKNLTLNSQEAKALTNHQQDGALSIISGKKGDVLVKEIKGSLVLADANILLQAAYRKQEELEDQALEALFEECKASSKNNLLEKFIPKKNHQNTASFEKMDNAQSGPTISAPILKYSSTKLFDHNMSAETIAKEIDTATNALETAMASCSKINSLAELRKQVQVNDNLAHKFVLGSDGQLAVNSVEKQDIKKMSHAALAELNDISSVKTAGYIKAIDEHTFAISDWSGHYRPSASSLHHIKLHLLEWGAYSLVDPSIP